MTDDIRIRLLDADGETLLGEEHIPHQKPLPMILHVQDQLTRGVAYFRFKNRMMQSGGVFVEYATYVREHPYIVIITKPLGMGPKQDAESSNTEVPEHEDLRA